MFSFIDTLRRQPLPVRRQVALITTALILGVVLVLWLVLSTMRTQVAESESPRTVNGIVAPY